MVGKVVDGDGNPIPGVTVTLSGIGAPQVFVTAANGNYRFLNQSPGRYDVRAELSWFLDHRTGPSTSASARTPRSTSRCHRRFPKRSPSAPQTPLIDVRNTGTGSDVNQQELREVPSARDPWVVLQTVPGVLVSTVNVGGNQSGQQSYFIGKGIERHQTEWNLDGVNVTEMQATGTSDFYYDFDSFQEMQISTGGSDPRLRTPGVQINMVAKRGTNDVRGIGPLFLDRQAVSVRRRDSHGGAESYLTSANSINNIDDYGFEAGGPILKDRLWLWGAYSKNDINNFIAGPTIPQLTHITSWNGKLNLQLTPANAGSALLHVQQQDRPRPGPEHHPPDRDRHRSERPRTRPEVRRHADLRQQLLHDRPFRTSCRTATPPRRSAAATSTAWWTSPSYERAIRTFRPDGIAPTATSIRTSLRRTTALTAPTSPPPGKVDHELKWGFEYRDTPVSSITSWPGNQTFGNFYDGSALAALTRDAVPKFGSKYKDIYVGDTILIGNLTINAGGAL